MSMLVGSATADGTLSKAIADLLEATVPGFDREKGGPAIESFANAIVQYIKDHAVVTVANVATGSATVTGTVT